MLARRFVQTLARRFVQKPQLTLTKNLAVRTLARLPVCFGQQLVWLRPRLALPDLLACLAFRPAQGLRLEQAFHPALSVHLVKVFRRVQALRLAPVLCPCGRGLIFAVQLQVVARQLPHLCFQAA